MRINSKSRPIPQWLTDRFTNSLADSHLFLQFSLSIRMSVYPSVYVSLSVCLIWQLTRSELIAPLSNSFCLVCAVFTCFLFVCFFLEKKLLIVLFINGLRDNLVSVQLLASLSLAPSSIVSSKQISIHIMTKHVSNWSTKMLVWMPMTKPALQLVNQYLCGWSTMTKHANRWSTQFGVEDMFLDKGDKYQPSNRNLSGLKYINKPTRWMHSIYYKRSFTWHPEGNKSQWVS